MPRPQIGTAMAYYFAAGSVHREKLEITKPNIHLTGEKSNWCDQL